MNNKKWDLTWKSWIRFWPKGEKHKDYPVKTYYKIDTIRQLLNAAQHNLSKTNTYSMTSLYSMTPFENIKYINEIMTLGDFVISKIKPYKTVIIKENYE